jgi:hypothetical protein
VISSITSIPINLSFFLTVIILFSKSGRPLIKKMSERKGNARPRHISSNAQLDSPVQSEDDHEELLAAANSALRSANSSPFWRQVEPFFSYLTTEDIAYLSQQVLQGHLILYQKMY